jgi:hypothetical protein
MYGLDADTGETAARMSRFVIDHRIALPMLNVLVPTPGTPMYARMKEEGRVLLQHDQDFLKNNAGYNASFKLCFYRPKNMTPAEVEEGFVELLGRLSGYWQILRRSLTPDPILCLFLLYSNWLFRKEYLELKKGRTAVGGSRGERSVATAHGQI